MDFGNGSETSRRVIRLSGDPQLKELGVLLYKAFPFGGNIRFVKNRRHRTHRLACAAISANSRIDVHLLLTGTSLYAIDRTDIDAGKLFGADAWLANYICQNFPTPSTYL
jgi:hypothetical protein